MGPLSTIPGLISNGETIDDWFDLGTDTWTSHQVITMPHCDYCKPLQSWKAHCLVCTQYLAIGKTGLAVACCLQDDGTRGPGTGAGQIRLRLAYTGVDHLRRTHSRGIVSRQGCDDNKVGIT